MQRGFPTLAEFPSTRIEFFTPVQLDAEGRVVNERWGRVMDEAWRRFDRDPPTRLRVQVADLPGEEEEREAHEKRVARASKSTVISPKPISTSLLRSVKAASIVLE